jgi:hypothetical protein
MIDNAMISINHSLSPAVEVPPMSYAFTFSNGRTFTPNGETAIGDVEAHNRALEARELEAWQAGAPIAIGYYTIDEPANGSREWSAWRSRVIGRAIQITTWLGTPIASGRVTGAYTNNFGGRLICLRVKGTNGAEYIGRASYDSGTIVRLRLASKGGR